MKPRLFVALAIATIFATGWYACGGKGGSSNSSPTSPSTGNSGSVTTFQGTLAGSGGQSGTIAVTISTVVATSSVSSVRTVGSSIKPLSAASASGTLILIGGGAIPLSGTFDSSTNTVGLSGEGFAFTGTIQGAVLSGTYTGPSSSGVFSSLNASQNSVTVYLGTLGGGGGVFNLQVSANGAVSGELFTTNGKSDNTLTGQSNGTTLSLTNAGGGSGTGTIQGKTISGTCPKTGNPGPPFTTSAVSVPTPPAPTPTPTPGITVTAGTWSYEIAFNVPLNATPDKTCVVPASGTTLVSSSGAFSVPFTVACERCSMSGTITGTIVPTGVSGSATGSLSGPIDGPGGCTNAMVYPTTLSGSCTSASCTGSSTGTGGRMGNGAEVALSFTLTPP